MRAPAAAEADEVQGPGKKSDDVHKGLSMLLLRLC